MNRRLWKERATATTVPAWTCGRCRSGTLRLLPGTMILSEHRTSKTAHAREEWDPSMIEEVFHCTAQCSACGDFAIVAGETSHDPDWDDEQRDIVFRRDFMTRAVIPAPEMLEIPARVPAPVAKEVRRAFELFWNDPAACLSRVRCAVEAVCDHAGVPKLGRRKDKTRFRIPLHGRIGRLPVRYDNVRNELLAVKWLGNDGAHAADATADDVLDALELLAFVFDRVFRRPEREIAKLSRAINSKRGSRHRPNRKLGV